MIEMVYLDNAATSLIKPAAVEQSVLAAMRSMASPGRGGYNASMKAAELVYSCRESASLLFKVRSPADIVFTLNATHALNIAISSTVSKGDRVVISGFEHNSVTRPLAALGADIIVVGQKLFDTADVIEQMERKITGAQAVICTHVSNVFGFILPVYEIGRLCRKQNIPFIIDASQSAGVLDIDFERTGADFIAMPGHKSLFGPQGTGILICGREGRPLMQGGTGMDSMDVNMPQYLPERLEAGTLNVCGIAGLKAGIDYVREKGCKNIYEHERKLLKLMVSELSGIPGIRLFASEGDDQCGVLSFICERCSSEDFAERLKSEGICVRAGLHCAPTAHRSAGTLAVGTVRLSFSPFISEPEIIKSAQMIKSIAKSIKKEKNYKHWP